jgi:hypothetical protein
MSARRLTSLTLVWLCAAAGCVAFTSAPALGLVSHRYVPGALPKLSEDIPVEGPHGEKVPLPGPLTLNVSSMALDSGHLWIAEAAGTLGNGNTVYRTDELNASTGAFISQLAHSEEGPRMGPWGIAVGHAGGQAEVYLGEDLGFREEEPGVAVFDEAGVQKTWTGAGTPAGSFGANMRRGFDVAVDASSNALDERKGDVFVATGVQGAIDVFRPEADGEEHYVGHITAAQIVGLPAGEAFEPQALAVSGANGDVIVLNQGRYEILEPAALGAYTLVGAIAETPDGPIHPLSLAVDGGNGEIYVADGTEPAVIDQFSSTGAYLGRFTGTDTPAGNFHIVYSLAIDPESHDVYVDDTRPSGDEHPSAVDVFGPDVVLPDVVTGSVGSLKPTSATLTGTVNPDSAGEAKCQFDWGTSTSFSETAACEPEGIANGASAIAVHAALSGLIADTTYHYRLQAQNANGANPGEATQDQEFTTPGPGIREQSTSDVASTSATLDAKIDPHGTPASYYFQYSTTSTTGCEASPASCTSVPSPPGIDIGSGEAEVEVSRHVQGLLAGTVYHYRVVVVSELSPGVFEAFEGEDQTFTTQPFGSQFMLPDSRQWEMVTPPDKLGANITPITEMGLVQAAIGGNTITYLTSSPTEAEAQGYTNGAMQVLSGRTASGWESQDLGVPHAKATGSTVGQGFEYRFFSEDLSLSVVQPFGPFDPSLSSEASEQTSFLHTDYLNDDAGEPCKPGIAPCYRPLVTGAPGYANVPAGAVFGACPIGALVCGPEFLDATPDLSHVILKSSVVLTAGGEAGHGVGEGGLYEWAAGKLTPVPTGVGQPADRHGISVDGSRIVLTGRNEIGGEELALRDVPKGETAQLDVAQGGTESGGGEYQTASADGSRVFFTDVRRLTAGSHGEGRDLYECRMVEVAGKLTCSLSDLTAGGLVSGPADVQGVLGASEDGSYVYFVAAGVLASGAVPGKCGSNVISEQAGEICDVYVYHDGATKLVGVLSGADAPDWSDSLKEQTARVSSDGRWLTFMSQRDLAGYVTSDAATGQPDEEVYLYDASSAALVCASCDPTGARPVGVPYGEINGGLVGGDRVWDSEQGIAANIPGWTPYRSGSALYQSRFLSDSGRLFFNSSDALVPQDVNGAEDVYEYEPPGVGNCETSSATYSERSHGCVDLISSGTSGEESGFLDASGTGGDVFFLTSAKLSAEDRDTALDIYDAQECTGASPCLAQPAVTPPPCTTGDACKAAPSPQPEIFGAPSSATFSGAGNITTGSGSPGSARSVKPKALTRAQKLARAVKACQRKGRKRRAVCERRARVRYAARQSGKATNARKRGSRG